MTLALPPHEAGQPKAAPATHPLPPPFRPRSPVSSSASGLSVDLTFNGSGFNLPPIAGVSGGAPPAYDKTRSIESFGKTQRLDPGSPSNPTLQTHATEVTTHAASRGFGVDAVSAHAGVSIGSSEFLLTSNPLCPLGLLGVLGLSLTATDVHSSSDGSFVVGANRGFLGGDASFGSLKIGGALIGKSLTFSGHAAANTVLFSSATVEVTLDKQTVSDIPSWGAGHTTIPVAITTDAIDIHLHNAPLFGRTVSGEIVVGETSANFVYLFPVPG